jgi:hypothetical protein
MDIPDHRHRLLARRASSMGTLPHGPDDAPLTAALRPALEELCAGSVPHEGAQSLSERGGVDAGAECELVEECRAEGGQDQRGVLGGAPGSVVPRAWLTRTSVVK